MIDTPEQIAAQAELDAAVEKYFKALGWDGFLSGWILIAHQHRVNEQTGEVKDSAHPIVYMGGSTPDHVALGLLQIGKDVIRGVGRWADDDEDEESGQ